MTRLRIEEAAAGTTARIYCIPWPGASEPYLGLIASSLRSCGPGEPFVTALVPDEVPGVAGRRPVPYISGTVHFLLVEGGCWQLQSEDGRRYELQPDQAPAALLRDEASVSVVGQAAEGSATGCQVGMPIDVRRVVSVDVGE